MQFILYDLINKSEGSNSDLLKTRVEAFKIISYLFIDDLYDNYILNIQTIIQKITFGIENNNPSKQQMIIFFNDAIGIISQIDLVPVYRALIKRLYPFIKKIYSDRLLELSDD